MATTTADDDQPAFWCGGSLFNTGGQRLNETDLDTHELPKTIGDMTADDWERAAAALREFEIERGIR